MSDPGITAKLAKAFSAKKVFAFTDIQKDIWKYDGVSGGRFVRDLEGKYIAVNGEKIESEIYTGQKASKFHTQTRHGNFSQLDSAARVQEDYKKHSDQEIVVYTKFCDSHGKPVPFGQRVKNGELEVADENGMFREIDTGYFDARIAEKAAREEQVQKYVDMCVIDDHCTMLLFGLNRKMYDAIFGGFDSQNQVAYEEWSYNAGYLGAHINNNRVAAADCRTSSFMMKHASTTHDSWDVLKIRAICEAFARGTKLSDSKKNVDAYRTEDIMVTAHRQEQQAQKGTVTGNILKGTAPGEISYERRGEYSQATHDLEAKLQADAEARSRGI